MPNFVAGLDPKDARKPCRVFEFTLTPQDPDTGEELTENGVVIFRSPEILCELDGNRRRTNLIFFTKWCEPWMGVLRGCLPDYNLVPDPEYVGLGRRPKIWWPIHQVNISKDPRKKLDEEGEDSKPISHTSTVVSAKDIERFHKATSMQGDLGYRMDGEKGTWQVKERPEASKPLVLKKRQAGEKPEAPKMVRECPNGVVIRNAIMKAFNSGALVKMHADGSPLFDPRDFPAIDAICSPDPEVNPLVNLPVVWRRRRVKSTADALIDG